MHSENDQKISAPLSGRTPETIRKMGNHLKGSQSLYLRQHEHNPLDWHPWGDEALDRSKAEDKPIFLSIGYSSCHWCHVMEHEVFEHDDVALFMNENFISIKVDREERPDLDAVYMDAVQALTGGGGWPLSVFLTPELKPFWGGTYYPKDAFMNLTTQLGALYRSKREKVEAQAAELYRVVSSVPTGQGGTIDAKILGDAAQSFSSYFDSKWGGFAGQMKFPIPVRWQFLLHHFRKTGDPVYARMLRITLNHIGSGGIHDHVGGGFHRYTVEPTWLVPHFEKMLYDNAQLAALYTEAAAVFEDKRYGEIARSTLDFLLRDAGDNGHGFFASFDADSGGKEGVYFTWSQEEINEVAGPEDGPALGLLMGVIPG